jgi:hypothetical protein
MLVTIALSAMAFVSGFLQEMFAVLWIDYRRKQRPVGVTLAGVGQATVLLVGVGESIHLLPCAIAYAVGYGLGGGFATAMWPEETDNG